MSIFFTRSCIYHYWPVLRNIFHAKRPLRNWLEFRFLIFEIIHQRWNTFHMLINCTPSIKHSKHLDQTVIFVKTVLELCNISYYKCPLFVVHKRLTIQSYLSQINVNEWLKKHIRIQWTSCKNIKRPNRYQ